jgi:hypothetical protein
MSAPVGPASEPTGPSEEAKQAIGSFSTGGDMSNEAMFGLLLARVLADLLLTEEERKAEGIWSLIVERVIALAASAPREAQDGEREDAERWNYLKDWASGRDIHLRWTHDHDGVRTENRGDHDVLWIHAPSGDPDGTDYVEGETLADALDDDRTTLRAVLDLAMRQTAMRQAAGRVDWRWPARDPLTPPDATEEND